MGRNMASPNKTATTLFFLSIEMENNLLILHNTAIPKEDNRTYLGIKFDKRLTWELHIEESERKSYPEIEDHGKKL